MMWSTGKSGICLSLSLYMHITLQPKGHIFQFVLVYQYQFGSEAWVLKKREEQRLEAVQMKFFRHLLGIMKLHKEKNYCIRGKTGAQNILKEIKQHLKKTLQHLQRKDTNRIPK